MMRCAIILIIGVSCASLAPAQSAVPTPHVGYVYPAGGQQGTKFLVTVGGQFLRQPEEAYVTGSGVTARVIKHFRPLRNVEPEQRQALRQRMWDLFVKRWEELQRDEHISDQPPRSYLGGLGMGRVRNADEIKDVELPEHPLLYDLESKSLRELLHVGDEIRQRRKGQRNDQIGEAVLLEISISDEAPPGERELRILTRLGLTNPLVFQVATFNEVIDLEPEDGPIIDMLPPEPPLAPPVLVNGQIGPGDVDWIRFSARRGERLVIETFARRLVPFMADAVPGWFQATLTLYDESGHELAFGDDYRYSPDPVLLFSVPEDGTYLLQVRDSIYRGREDFVYRICISERPFVTSLFPLGCHTGQQRYARIDGWNLWTDRVCLDAKSQRAAAVSHESIGRGERLSNPIAYAVDPRRAVLEKEDNDALAGCQRLSLPQVVDGRISEPGDIDHYRFRGRGDTEIIAEVVARQAESPLDSLLRLIDADGNVLAWNDDVMHKTGHLHTTMGTLTHHADSYLRAHLPKDGVYYVQVSDALGAGSEAHAYRLRVGPPQPDFALRVTPSSVAVRTGFAAPLQLYAQRKDGFTGPIEVRLKDAPRGFSLVGAVIPAGQDSVRATLSAPPGRQRAPVSLQLEGRAQINGMIATRPVQPAEDMMQAFLWRHLTPSQELVVAVLTGQRLGQPLHLAGNDPVRLRPGRLSTIEIIAPPHPRIRRVQLELDDPPEGVTIREIRHTDEHIVIELNADRETLTTGQRGHLFVAASVYLENGRREDGQQRWRHLPLGLLPAIPYEVVSP